MNIKQLNRNRDQASNRSKWVKKQAAAGLMLISLALLAACSGIPKSGDNKASVVKGDDAKQSSLADDESVIELAVDQQRDALVPEQSDAELDLPNLELDAQTLEKLLLTNLASYQGQWGLALENSLATAQSSRDPRLARISTLLAMRDNNYPAAVAAGLLWRELAKDSEDAINLLIIAQVGSGQVDAAIASLSEHRAEKSIDKHIRQAAGLLVRQRNAEAAIEVAENYVQQNAESAQVMLSTAYVAETFKDLSLSEAWLSRALELKPGWDLAAQMKANMLRRQGKSEQRSEFIQQFVAQFPASVTMRTHYAAELAREKKYQEALSLMQEVLQDAPRDVPALSYAGALAMQIDDLDLAKKYYTKALYQAPKDDEVRWALARIAVIQKKYQTAERLYRDISSKENYFSAQLQVANMRYQTQGIKMAVNTLRALHPETEGEYIEIALTRHYLLMQDKQYEEAFAYISETLIYLPDNQDLIYARALVAAELKKVEVAEADFRALIRLKPDHANALNALGYTLADQTDRLDEALELIEAALVLRPKDSHILDSRGWVAYRMGDLEVAIEYLQKAYSAEPQAEIAAHLGEVLWEAGQQEKAQQVWQESFAEDSDNLVLNQTLEKYGVSFTADVQ